MSRVEVTHDSGSMMPYREAPEPTLIERALGDSIGQTYLARARERLFDDIRRNRFSSARAARAFTSSIDDAVWAYLGESSLRRIIYRDHLMRLDRSEKGRRFAAAFIRETGATERRVVRRRLPFGKWLHAQSFMRALGRAN